MKESVKITHNQQRFFLRLKFGSETKWDRVAHDHAVKNSKGDNNLECWKHIFRIEIARVLINLERPKAVNCAASCSRTWRETLGTILYTALLTKNKLNSFLNFMRKN